jgi:hypothetical protein
VDRTDDDYTRLVALNAPELRPETNFGEIARHAQRRMDAVDLDADRIVSGPFAELIREQEDFPLDLFTTREEAGKPAFLTFDRLLAETAFVADLRDLLAPCIAPTGIRSRSSSRSMSCRMAATASTCCSAVRCRCAASTPAP